jgi:hypothetical protein
MFDLHNNYWILSDGRIWSSARAVYVPDDDADYLAWLTFDDNKPSRAPDEQGAVSETGLREALRFYGLPLGELAGPEERRAEIAARIAEIEQKDQPRCLREKALGAEIIGQNAFDFAVQKLVALNAEIDALRTELAGLVQMG